MKNFYASWMLLGQSFSTLMSNKRLIIFPIISNFMALSILIIANIVFVFLVTSQPMVVLKKVETFLKDKDLVPGKPDVEVSPAKKAERVNEFYQFINRDPNSWKEMKDILFAFAGQAILVFFLVILFQIYFLPFYHTALFNIIIGKLNNKTISIRDSIKYSLSKKKELITWTKYEFLEGMKFWKLKNFYNPNKDDTSTYSKFTWNKRPYFVIPIIIRENRLGSINTILSNSDDLIREKWKEGLIGMTWIAIGLISSVVILILIFFFIGMAILFTADYPLIQIFYMSCIMIILSITVMSIINLFSSIFQCALYLYASEGVLPLAYEDDRSG